MTRTRSLAVLAALAVLSPQTARGEGIALKFTRAVYGDDKDLRLSSPEGVGCGDDGRMVVADTGNGRLVAFTMIDGVPSKPKELKIPELKHPTRVVLDSKGNTWVLDRKERKIARLGEGYAFAGWFAPKESPGFMPVSFVVTAAGTLVVIDASGPAVVELEADGRPLRRVPLPKGQFTDLWADAKGTVFVVDAVAAQVWTAEKGSNQFKALTRSLKDSMNFPTQIVSNGRGRLFLVDQNGMGIVILGLDGSYQGRQLAMGWTPGLLYYPTQLCVTSKGIATVADRGNNRIQVFTTLE